MKKFHRLLVSVALMVGGFANAQAVDFKLLASQMPRTIDVNEAVKRAISHNSDLALSTQRVQLAKSDTWLSASKLLPKISAQGSFLASNKQSILSERAQALLKVSLPLLDAKALIDLRSKREQEKSSNDALTAAHDNIITTVVSSYIEALIARGVMQNAELAKKVFRDEFSLAERRVRAGVARSLDVTRANYLAEKAESEYVLRVQDYDKLLGQLGKLIGEHETFSLKMVSLTSPYLDKSTDDLIALAQSSADMEAARRDLLAAEYATTSEKFDFLPRLFATIDGGRDFAYENSVVTPGTSAYSVNAMVNIEIPIFTGGARIAAIKARRAQETMSAVTFRSKEQEKRLLVTGLRSQIDDFVKVKSSAELALESATKAQQSAERLFAQSEITGLEMTEANTNLFNARNEAVGATLRLEQAKLKLLLAIGKVRELFR